MASVDITEDDVIEALTKPCPFSYDGMFRGIALCFPHLRCGKCEDGLVLTHTGRKLARLMQRPAPVFESES